MKAWQWKCLAWIFSAFLPKNDSNDNNNNNNNNNEEQDEDYYAILGVSRNAAPDEIRRAYRKKSLQLHPDKIAQRRHRQSRTDQEQQQQQRQEEEEEEAAHAEFQKMKEAYEILSHPKKRELYDALGKSGSIFLRNPTEAYDARTLYRNLARSSFLDRTKLFLLIVLVLGLVFVQPILIATKVDQMLHQRDDGGEGLVDTHWVVILIPLWVFDGIVLLLLLLVMVMGHQQQQQQQQPVVNNMLVLQWTCLIVGEVFLALKWDDTIDWTYSIVFIPLYIFEALRLVHASKRIKQTSVDMERMVTTEYLEKHVLSKKTFAGGGDGDGDGHGGDFEDSRERDIVENYRNHDDEENQGGFYGSGDGNKGPKRLYSDLTDEERDEINKQYIIVHVPPGVSSSRERRNSNSSSSSSSSSSNDDGDDSYMSERLKVEQSPEYQVASMHRDLATRTFRTILIFHTTLIGLVVAKLDGDRDDWSWWLVFIPAWVHIGWRWVMNCCICCCAGVGSSPDLIAMAMSGDDDDDDNEKEGVGDGNIGTAAHDATVDGRELDETRKADVGDLDGDGLSGANANSLRNAPNVDGEERDGAGATLSTEKNDGWEKGETLLKNDTWEALPAKVDSDSATHGRETSRIDKENDEQEEKTEENASAEGTKPDDEEDQSEIEIDEDIFREWQQAHAEAESHAMEAQSKAMGDCCYLSLHTIVLCLFVAKLEAVFDEKDDEGLDFGDGEGTDTFSAFWILFPYLLLGGLTLCCCCCAIYCARDVEALEEMVERAASKRSMKEETDEREHATAQNREESDEGIAAGVNMRPQSQTSFGLGDECLDKQGDIKSVAILLQPTEIELTKETGDIETPIESGIPSNEPRTTGGFDPDELD